MKSIVVNIGQMTAKFPEDEGSLSNEEVLLGDNEPSTPEVKVDPPQEKSPDSDYCVLTGHGGIINEQRYSYHGKLSIEEGWKWVTKFHKPQPSKTRHLYCELSCDECSPTGRFSVYVPSQEWPGWTVSYDTDIIQTDGCSCGPIACAKVMEVFGLLEPAQWLLLRTILEGITLW